MRTRRNKNKSKKSKGGGFHDEMANVERKVRDANLISMSEEELENYISQIHGDLSHIYMHYMVDVPTVQAAIPKYMKDMHQWIDNQLYRLTSALK